MENMYGWTKLPCEKIGGFSYDDEDTYVSPCGTFSIYEFSTYSGYGFEISFDGESYNIDKHKAFGLCSPHDKELGDSEELDIEHIIFLIETNQYVGILQS